MLLIGINYAPEQTGIAPYTTGLAEHLAAHDWDVTVVTGMPHYPQWRVHDNYRWSVRANEMRAGVRLRRVHHHTPAHPTALSRSLYELTFLLHAMTVRVHRPRCVLGVVPSLSGGVSAALHAARHKVPFGLVVQDLMGPAAAQSGIPGGQFASGPARVLEGWTARRATGLGIVAESFRPYLEGIGVAPERITHLPNWSRLAPPSGSAAEQRRALAWPVEEQIVLHAGNIGFKQGLHNVVAAARLAAERGLPIRFVLMGDGSDRRRLEDLGAGLPTLEFLDPQPEDTFMDIMAAADVLLINEQASVQDMSLPSKITSYLLAGRPVVAAVRDGGSTAAALHESGAALVVPAEHPGLLLGALRSLAGDHALQTRLATNGFAYAREHFDATTQLAKAARFVMNLCVSSPSPPSSAAR